MTETEFDIFDDAPMGELFDTDPRRLGISYASERAEARKERQLLRALAARSADINAGWRCHLAHNVVEGMLPSDSEDRLVVSMRIPRPIDTRRKAEGEQV